MSGIQSPTDHVFVGALGGMVATAGTLAVAQRVVRNGPVLSGNVGAALLLGGMGGLTAVGLSNILGGSAWADAAAVGGLAAAGGAMMMGHGSGAAGRGAAIMGAAALGGIVLKHFAD